MILIRRVFLMGFVLVSSVFGQQGRRAPNVGLDKKKGSIPTVNWDKTMGKKVSKVSLVSRKNKKSKKVAPINAVVYDFVDRAMDSIQSELKKFSLYLGKISPPPALVVKNKKQGSVIPKNLKNQFPISKDVKLENLKKGRESNQNSLEESILRQKQSIEVSEKETQSLEVFIKSLQEEQRSLLEHPFEKEQFPPSEKITPPSTNSVKKDPKARSKKIDAQLVQNLVVKKKVSALQKQRKQWEKKLDFQKLEVGNKKRDLDKFIQKKIKR